MAVASRDTTCRCQGRIDVVVANTGIANNGTIAANGVESIVITLSSVGDLVMRRTVPMAVPELEREVTQLGREFGRHSVAADRPEARTGS